MTNKELYEKYCNAFIHWTEKNDINAKQFCIFTRLLYEIYLAEMKEWTTIDNRILMIGGRISIEKIFIKHRDRLIELGLIECIKDKKSNSAQYKLNEQIFVK